MRGRCRMGLFALGLRTVSVERLLYPNTERGGEVHRETWAKEVKAWRPGQAWGPGSWGSTGPDQASWGPGTKPAGQAVGRVCQTCAPLFSGPPFHFNLCTLLSSGHSSHPSLPLCSSPVPSADDSHLVPRLHSSLCP